MSIRKTGAVTGHVIRARDGEIPVGIDEEGHVVTARLEGTRSLGLGPGGWTMTDEDELAGENRAADLE